MRSPLVALALALVVGLALAGCTSPATSDEDAVPDAGRRDSGSGCVDECPGSYTCRADVVYAYEQDDATACTCGLSPVATCARGCNVENPGPIHAGTDEEARILCEENRPKQVGDACAAPEDCRPEVAVVDPVAQTIESVYLRCDTEQHACVAREPTVVGDWLAACGLPQDLPVDVGPVVAPACAGGLCLIARAGGCLHQGCTVPCVADGECPAGALCRDGACAPPAWVDLATVLTCPAP